MEKKVFFDLLSCSFIVSVTTLWDQGFFAFKREYELQPAVDKDSREAACSLDVDTVGHFFFILHFQLKRWQACVLKLLLDRVYPLHSLRARVLDQLRTLNLLHCNNNKDNRLRFFSVYPAAPKRTCRLCLQLNTNARAHAPPPSPHVHTHTHTRARARACTHARTHAHTHSHTHTHTHWSSRLLIAHSVPLYCIWSWTHCIPVHTIGYVTLR